MSIQNIARELYKTQQKVERLEKEAAAAKGAAQERLQNELRMARKELGVIRKMLDGEKERGAKRTGRFHFSL